METSERLSATLVIPLAAAIENARLATKRHLLTLSIAAITAFVWISSLATWPSVERTLLVTLAVAIENAWLAMKGYSLAVLTVVITLFVLLSSLAAWPSVERMLLVKMRGAIIESANDQKLPLNLSLDQSLRSYRDGSSMRHG